MNKFLIIFFSIFTVSLMYLSRTNVFSTRVFLTSVVIQVISIVFIFSRPGQPYSLNKIFYLFSLFFFGIAPLIQFYERESFFGARLLKEKEVFYTNLLVIVILVLYQLAYWLFYFFYKEKRSFSFAQKFNLKYQLNRAKSLRLFLISAGSLLLVLYTLNFDFLALILRGGQFVAQAKEGSVTSNLIVIQSIRPLAMMCLYFYLVSKSKNYLLGFVLFAIAILAVFPTGVPRFYAAAMYIPLLILVIPALQRKNIFSIVLVLGLLVVYPLLNYFREFSSFDKVKVGFDFKMFNTGHFDSYQNFALIVTEDFVTWGYQLLGVLFFWVPRAFWPTKPVGSGEFLAEHLGFYFSNVSANFFAEGYINFGFAGILIFILFLGFFTARMDKLYWKLIIFEDDNFLKVIYLILLGMLFFILRGDLLSSFAFTIGFFISYVLVIILVGIRR